MVTNSIDSGSRFLASTLHEIRTPIQTIISTTELLEDTSLDKEQTEYVHQIEFSANVLLQLANDVLDFTKIRSKEFKLEYIPYDITELTEHVVDLISIDAFDKGLEVVTDIDYTMPRMIMGDPTRVQQIILNLVKNAVKFTGSGYVLVRLFCKGNALVCEIVDSGIGVAKEKQALIFKDFYQVDASTTRKYGGTGLGLSICKNLVKVMGGTIGVRPNPKGGSIFWFTLPLIKANFESEKNDTPITLSQEKILLVDNHRLALSSFAKKLKALGLEQIETVTTSTSAIHVLKTAAEQGTPFTIAFINMLMPQIDGWKLAALINNSPIITKLPLYLMVAEGQMGKDAKMKMLDLFAGYLYKPIKREQLLDIFSGHKPTEPARTEKLSDASQSENSIAKGSKILVAEDHPVNRKLIHTFLEKFGATVYLAENGEEAIKQIAEHPDIDMIFMDILMPIKSGIDATVAVRNNNYKGIIIACTANNDMDDFTTYKQLGINDILVKPFKRTAVKQMLEKWNTVLSFPAAKDIVSFADINNKMTNIWDLGDFMDTSGGDKRLAMTLMSDYMEQTQQLLSKIKDELAKPQKDFSQLKLYVHTLKGSSAAVSVHKLADYGKKMEKAVMEQDAISLEAIRITFAIDFLKLKQIVKNWESNPDE